MNSDRIVALREGIDRNGNVGIGTTTPNAKLEVTGQIRRDVFRAGATAAIDWNNENNQYNTMALTHFCAWAQRSMFLG